MGQAEHTRPLGAQISHALKARGVDVVFGIPGVHNVEMYRGIEEAGMTHVLARHEQGAGFMADGYARATGKPGVCYTITGPGLTNAMTALGQAYSDSVPVLAISSCLDETAGRRGQLHQMLDQQAAGATVCDWSYEARSAADAYRLLDRAFAEFAAQRPRSKHIQIPIALAGSEAVPAPVPPARPVCPKVAHAQVVEAATRILEAEKPLFVFGGGARGSEAYAEDVLRMTGAAAFTSYAGRGVLKPDTALNFGAYLARGSSGAVFEEADLIVALGTEFAEVDIWREAPGHSCPMIRVDLDPEVLTQCKAGDMPLLGDAVSFLHALSIAIPARVDDKAPCWDAAFVNAKRSEWRAETSAERPGILPVIDAVRAALPEEVIVYSDMTQFAYMAKEVWEIAPEGAWYHPSGFGTLGYALPAAIGGKIGSGDRPVVAIAGDYGFQYTLQELGVAVELGLGLPILLWDNGKLKEIEDAMVASQIAPNAVVARNPDFCKLADAYGAASVAPDSLEAIGPAIREALGRDGPTLIYLNAMQLGG